MPCHFRVSVLICREAYLPSALLSWWCSVWDGERERTEHVCVCVFLRDCSHLCFTDCFLFTFRTKAGWINCICPVHLWLKCFASERKKKKTGCEYQHPSHSQCFKFSAFTLKDLMFIFSEVQFQPQNNLFSFICTFPWFWLWKSVRQKQEERD